VAIIMAGGSGERFWPLSTPQRPKQLLKLTPSGMTLLEESVARVAPLVGNGNVYISTGKHLTEPMLQTLQELSPEHLLAEPEKKNTLGAVLWSMASVSARINGPISFAFVTADHLISPADAFQRTASKALDIAERTGALVTVGIPPTRAETGYGYIEAEDGSGVTAGSRVKRFLEKPDAPTAESFLKSGRFLWNSGMFFWTEEGFLEQLRQANPGYAALYSRLCEAIQAGDMEGAAAHFSQLPSLSIDYALMEKASNVYVVRAEFDWDDLGAFDSLQRSMEADESGSVITGEVQQVDSHGNVVYNATTGQTVHLLGVEGLVVVITDNDVMICPKHRAQEVRKLAPKNRDKGASVDE
jgi:mannose-1-phosphate guanylyltransferase